MRDDLGRMAQHFENLRDEPTRPRLRCLLAGAAAGAFGKHRIEAQPRAFYDCNL